MTSPRWATSVALVLLFIAACGRSPTAQVRPAPPFDLPDLNGGRATMASFTGKVVVLDFWATWCGPCIAEIPDYAEFARRNGSRGVEVIGVVFESGDPQEIQDFVREHKITYRQLLGTEAVAEAFGANQGFPTTFVVDSQGAIRLIVLGSTPDKFQRLQKAVDDALAAPASEAPKT